MTAWASEVMLGPFGRERPLCFHPSKEEDSPELGHHSHLIQEEGLDHHGEELLHWQSLLQVFMLHSFEYSLPLTKIQGSGERKH